MLPPRTTGWAGSAARIAAVSDDVVVLPFVPVTPIVGAGHSRRNRSGSETSAGAVGSPAARAATSARSAARRRGSVVGKSGCDRRRRRDERGAGPGRGGVDVRAQRQPHRPALERRDRVAELGGRPAVVDRHARARVGEEPGEGDAAAGEPEDRDRSVAQGAGADASRSSARRGRSVVGGSVMVVTAAGPARPGTASRRAARRGCRRSRSGS